MKARLSELAVRIGAELHGADGDFRGASIDTRRVERGNLFFALPGSRVDGHDFVARAASLGAAAAVVDRLVDSPAPQLQVMDVEAALQRAGAASRHDFDGPVIGVTGSNGKTTVKQMLAAILDHAGSVLATEGNLNNHLGVPLTLMRLDESSQRAVVEMGASSSGEIAMLCDMARPDIAVVTNAGVAHLEGFGSREGVARAKGEIYAGLADDGTAVINADDAYAGLWSEIAGTRSQIRFARREGEGVDVYASHEELAADGSRFTLHTPTGSARVNLKLAGAHNISNALAAAAVAGALNLDADLIARGLAGMAAVGGRMVVTSARDGARLVDDSYNANPESLAAALGWLAQQPGPRWAVLGDMGELGDYAEQAHIEAGTTARQAGVSRLWLTGPLSRHTAESFGEGARWFTDHDALSEALLSALAHDSAENNHTGPVTVLVKGSRSARMDRVADALRMDANARAGAPC